MPVLNTRIPQFKTRKGVDIDWNEFRGGWNPLLRPTELKDNELAQADNIMLAGSGVPKGRWGTSKYFVANSTGTVKGLGTFMTTKDGSTNRLIALTDEGYLCYKNNSSFTRINGQSYPSGSLAHFTQLGEKTYIVSENRPLTVYDGSNLSVYATVAAPTGLSVSNVSGTSGTQIYSWKVVTLTDSGGNSEASSPITLENLPFYVENSLVRLQWTAPSAAASVITGYEIYRGPLGDETYLAAVGASTTTYFDTGLVTGAAEAPVFNTTGGVQTDLIAKVKDRLVVVDKDDPTRLMISGRYPNQSNFSTNAGGGYIYVDPDSGQKITGIVAQPGSDNIIVFKEYSSFAVSIATSALGNETVLNPSYEPVSTLVGCSSQDTIQVVENDIFYLGKGGVYVIGYEPNFLNIIRTNEISARVRPYLDKLSGDDYKNACAMYINNKYILSFPDRKEMIVYDRERGCWLGPWQMPYGINKMLKYTDSNNTEKWVLGSANSNQIYTFETSVNSDDGTTISKTLRTKKEYFGSWSILKIIKYFKILFRNITGSIDVNVLLEDRNGSIQTIKTFSIEGSAIAGASGWGIDNWGSANWGTSEGEVVIEGDEFYRWTQLFKEGRILQIEILSNTANTNFELLGVNVTASQQSAGQLPASQRV
jgi:hypothetical protein